MRSGPAASIRLLALGSLWATMCGVCVASPWSIKLSGDLVFGISERDPMAGWPPYTIGWNTNLALPSPVVFPVTLKRSAIGSDTKYWSDVGIWEQPTVAFAYAWQFAAFGADLVTGQGVSAGGVWNCWETAFNGGPTERSISIPILPEFFTGQVRDVLDALGTVNGSISTSIPMRFAVGIDTGATVFLNQPSILDGLTVNGDLAIGSLLTIRTAMVNNGKMSLSNSLQATTGAQLYNNLDGLVLINPGWSINSASPATGTEMLHNSGEVRKEGVPNTTASIGIALHNYGLVQSVGGGEHFI